MAAGEDQLQALVGHRRVLVVGELLCSREQVGLAGERLLAPDPVDRAVASCRDDPRTRVRGRAVARPPLQDRDAARTLVTEGAGDVVYAPAPVWSTTGLISIVPTRAEGIRAAHSIASSSDSAARR